jgi:hypothetical protein
LVVGHVTAGGAVIDGGHVTVRRVVIGGAVTARRLAEAT